MAVYKFDFRKTQPASGSKRADYIKPGTYRFAVTDYDDKPSQGGKEMHTFTYQVVTKGNESGKQIIDRFAMPKSAKQSQFPKERLLSFFLACGSTKALGQLMNFDPATLVKAKRQFDAEVVDSREEARTVDGTTYPARTVSSINRYIFDSEDEDEDAEEDDEEEEDEEEEEEEDDEEEEEEEDDEDEEEDDEDEEDEDEEDEDEEEDEEPPPAKRRSSSKAAAAPAKTSKAKPATKPAAKAPAPKSSTKSKRSKSDDDDADFPFDD